MGSQGFPLNVPEGDVQPGDGAEDGPAHFHGTTGADHVLPPELGVQGVPALDGGAQGGVDEELDQLGLAAKTLADANQALVGIDPDEGGTGGPTRDIRRG